jgi:hypothetical protein
MSAMDVTEPEVASKDSPNDAPASSDVGRKEIWQGEEFTLVEEGKAKILYPKGHQVFYNPVQEYNRDMSVMMLRLFAQEWTIQGTKWEGPLPFFLWWVKNPPPKKCPSIPRLASQFPSPI